jgi:hypothetical protein
MAKDFSHIDTRINQRKKDLALIEALLLSEKITEDLIRKRNIILVDIRTLEDVKKQKGKGSVDYGVKIYGNINFGTEE